MSQDDLRSVPCSPVSEASTSDSNGPGCVPSGSASRESSASESSRSTGQGSPVTPTSESCRGGASLPSTSSVADSPARTSAGLGLERASGDRARVFGQSMPVLLARLDLDGSSWRTSQLSLLGGWASFSETWPRAGMMRSGTAFQLQPLVPLIRGIGSGLLPTPRATDADRGGRGDLLQVVRGNTSPSGRYSPRMWQTPRVSSAHGVSRNEVESGNPKHRLETQVALLDIADLLDRGAAERLWPTPVKSDWKGPNYSEGGSTSAHGLSTRAAGQLNPTWVEWLMGFPLGWTELVPSEMLSSRRLRSGWGVE